MDKGEPNPQEPTWIVNAKGVKSCLPYETAKQFVDKRVNWSYTEPEDVPLQKEYPEDLELTESGSKRRTHLKKLRAEAEKKAVEKSKTEVIAELGEAELRAQAKKAGIKKYWNKSVARLRREMSKV